MRNTALAFKDEYEVPVSSIEVIEANVAALRDSLNEFKAEVRAGFADMRDEIKNLYGEIKSMREKHDRNFERLSTKIDATNQEVSQLSKAVAQSDAKLGASTWILVSLSAVGGIITVINTLAKVFHWG